LEVKLKAFISWSGGKETSLAFYRVIKKEDIKIGYLLNMISSDGKDSCSHGVSAKLLKAQAEAMQIPIVQRKTTWKRYEEEFKKAVSDLKRKGVGAGVFGDIDLQEHRCWVERVCQDLGITSILPLWKEEREKLLEEFIQAGFRAKVCAINACFLDEEWLGREIDKKFIEDLKTLGNIDLCGERGEYHTFVYDGPIFKKSVKFILGRKVLEGKHYFLELKLKD